MSEAFYTLHLIFLNGLGDHVSWRVSDPIGGVSRVAPPARTQNTESPTGAATRLSSHSLNPVTYWPRWRYKIIAEFQSITSDLCKALKIDVGIPSTNNEGQGLQLSDCSVLIFLCPSPSAFSRRYGLRSTVHNWFRRLLSATRAIIRRKVPDTGVQSFNTNKFNALAIAPDATGLNTHDCITDISACFALQYRDTTGA